MSKTTSELDTLLRTKARTEYHARVDKAWIEFRRAVEIRQGDFVHSLHECGKIVNEIKKELSPQVEQAAVEGFLKKFEQFGEQLADLEAVAHEH